MAVPDILYPKTMWAIDEWPIPLYPDTLSGLNTAGGEQVFTVATSGPNRRPYVRQSAMMGQLDIDPARCGSTLQFRAVSLSNPSSHARKDVTLASAPLANLSGKSPTILMIGDSLFESSGTVPRLYDALVTHGASPTFLGTIDGKDAYEAGATVRPCEARGGKSLSHYSNADDTILSVPTSTAAYLALTSDQREAYNPFIRPAVGGETISPPAYVRNGHVFDLRMYLTRFGFPDPDFVFVNSLANDIGYSMQGKPTANAVSNVADGMLVLARRIRNALPSAHIVFSFQATAFSSGVWYDWDTDYVPCIRGAMQTVNSLADANTFLLPVWAHQSRFIKWGGVSETSAETPSVPQNVQVTDDVHYREIGTAQAVETFLRFLVNHV